MPADGPGPAKHAELADSLSMAFLVLLEALSPVERAVFMLREVFEYGYPDVARTTGKTEVNCRQIFARARQRIAAGDRARGGASPPARRSEGEELARRFFEAAAGGDMDALLGMLAPDVVLHGGAVTYDAEGRVVSVAELDVADGMVQAIHAVANPDKLGHTGPVSDVARLPEKN